MTISLLQVLLGFLVPPTLLHDAPQPQEHSRFSLEALTSPDTELWLIQAPCRPDW